MTPIISVDAVSKTYATGFKALAHIDLQINAGEIFALLGPNGAGKTTLIGLICGIVRLDVGRVTVAGRDIIGDYRAVREMIGLVPQELTTDAFESVWNTVSFSRGLFGKPPSPAYIEKTLVRISNPHLPDTCERVGRNPMRKLSRRERFIGPAAELAERGMPFWNLLNAVGAALRFDVAEDAESVELQALLASGASAETLAATITGLEPAHPLFPHLVEVIELRLAR